MNGRGILSVVRFQSLRAFHSGRIIWWLLLVAFSPSVILLSRWSTRHALPENWWPIIFYGLLPTVTCMMGVFLWATPAVQSEVEAKSWVYFAVRPHGSLSLVIGNYLVAVLWTASAAWLSLLIAIAVAPAGEGTRMGLALVRLIGLSTLAYASLFSLIGVIFPKHGMLVATVYTVLVEGILGSVPAMVNQMTIQYRLRSLWVHWMGWTAGPPGWKGPREFFETTPPLGNLAALLIGSALFLGLTVFVVRSREFSIEGESAN